VDEKELLQLLNERYGSSYTPCGKLILRKEKLFVYSGPEIHLKYDWCGLHIANTDLSLTIEGAQILGTTASKNIVSITMEQAKYYYLGNDIPGVTGEGFCILESESRIIGPGLLFDGKVKNILPASRKTRI
jgi:NOL1/NOP2/fmu family ribosome biogenesis protein